MKAVIFDLYNTLIDVKTDEHRESSWTPVVSFLAARGIEADERTLIRLYDEKWSELVSDLEASSPYEYPEGDITEVYKRMAEALGGRLNDEAAAECALIARKASIVRLGVFDGIAELFAELRDRGAKLYLLSNAQSSFTPYELSQCGLTDAFDGVLLSSDCGVRKPDIAFFAMLCEKFGIAESSAVMVGDDEVNDGKGALDFGIKYVKADGGAAAHKTDILRVLEELENA